MTILLLSTNSSISTSASQQLLNISIKCTSANKLLYSESKSFVLGNCSNKKNTLKVMFYFTGSDKSFKRNAMEIC